MQVREHARKSEAEILSGDSRETDSDGESRESDDCSVSLCIKQAETDLRNQDREIHKDSSSGT